MQPDAPQPRWRLAALYAVLAALTVAPVLAVRVPLLGDIPNHLARIHILESLRNGSGLATYYQRPHRLVPYQAMDVVVGVLRGVLPLYAAGRVFVALCLLVPAGGAAMLRFAVQRRVGLAPAAGFLLSYNFLIARGLLDYLFAAGLCLALFAVWLMAAGLGRWRRAALCGAGLALVFLGHAYAGVTYCLLVAGDQVAAAVRRRFRPAREVGWDWLSAAAQVAPCLVLAVAFGASGGFGTASVTQYGPPARKVAAFLTPVMFPGPDWIFAIYGALPLLVVGLLVTRRVRLHPALVGPALAVALAAAAAPSVLFNAWATDMRLPIVLYVVVIAGLMPRRPVTTRLGVMLAMSLLVLVGARCAAAFVLLRQLDTQAAEVRQLVSALPMGKRLLAVDGAPANAPLRVADPELTNHAALLATIDRDALVPYLLTGATPVEARPAFRAASSPNSGAIDMAQLRDGAVRQDPPGTLLPYGYGGNMYWLGWRQKFDYVLIMTFGDNIGALPAGLHEVARVPIAQLYSIDRK